MGTFLAVYFYATLIAPTILFVATLVTAVILARRLRSLDPHSRPPWQWIAGHMVASLGAASLPFLAIPAMGIVPAALLTALRRAQAAHASGARGEEGRGAIPELEAKRGAAAHAPPHRRRWASAGIMAAAGTLIPWGVGAAVKVMLDALGQPTFPWSAFLNPVAIPIYLVLTAASWSFPFLILASMAAVPWRVGFRLGSPGRDSMLPLWLAFGAGAAAEIPFFFGIFQEWDAMMLLVPLGGIFLVPMAAGYSLGWFLVRERGEE